MAYQQYKYANQLPEGSNNRIEKIAIVGVSPFPCLSLLSNPTHTALPYLNSPTNLTHSPHLQASGHIGSSITRALLSTGRHTLTAITRTNSTSSFPSSPNLHISPVDYSYPTSLTTALAGHDALIITLSVHAPPSTMHALLDAASSANIPWVLPNYFSSDPHLTQFQNDSLTGPATAETVAYVEKKGNLSYIQMACGFWYEHSLCAFKWGFGFDALAKEALFYDEGTTRIATSTFARVGHAVARLFSLPVLPAHAQDAQATLSRFGNGPVYVASFGLSQKDMFASLLRVTGSREEEWKVEYRPVREVYEEGRRGLGEGKGAVAFATCLYSRMFFPTGEGDFTDKLDNGVLGLGMVGDEDVDEATGRAVQLQREGYGGYGAGAEVYERG